MKISVKYDGVYKNKTNYWVNQCDVCGGAIKIGNKFHFITNSRDHLPDTDPTIICLKCIPSKNIEKATATAKLLLSLKIL